VQSTPLVTVGIVALNRAWIIDKVLSSIQSQTYPHTALFILFVDGVSKDGTADVAKQKLAQSDFSGYEVTVQKCNIPEGRNICLGKMRGELLLFWDSDVIMRPDSVARLVQALKEENADLMTAVSRNVNVVSTDEIPAKLAEIASSGGTAPRNEIKAAMMGQSLLTKRLASTISFDPQLTNQEDVDFCLRAKEQGFRIMVDPNIKVLDVNDPNKAYSDIYIDMPLKDSLRGIRKKSQVQVYAYDFSGFKGALKFFSSYKRYVFYLLYIPAFVLTVIGVWFWNIYLSLVFPLYALFYTVLQIRRRGVGRGVRAFVISILVGIPNSVWVTFYWIKYLAKGTKKPYPFFVKLILR
jgi:glycosyltransferase involved in cell wall biosynthesis